MAYRDDREAAKLYRDELRAQKQREIATLGELRRLYSRRAARLWAGLAGLTAAALFFLEATRRLIFFGVEGRGLDEESAFPVSLLLPASWALVALVYLAAQALVPYRLGRELRRLCSPSEDPWADIARLERAAPGEELRARAAARERLSIAAPLLSLSLLAPLSLHLLVAAPFSEGRLRELFDFDSWVYLSLIFVGAAHLTLAYLSWRFAARASRLDSSQLEAALGRYGWKALGITLLASLFPPVLYSTGVVAITGLVFVPGMFSWALYRLREERATLGEPTPDEGASPL